MNPGSLREDSQPGVAELTIAGIKFTVVLVTFLAWVVCCSISHHMMILLRIIAFKISNSRVYMCNYLMDKSTIL